MAAEYVYAADVRTGDLIRWVSRVVEVVEIRTLGVRGQKLLTRPARYLMCDIGNEDDIRRLHWYDDEVIHLHARVPSQRVGTAASPNCDSDMDTPAATRDAANRVYSGGSDAVVET